MAVRKISREQCDAAMMEARRRFGHRRNVTGFDVGYRWDGGKRTEGLCARIHVAAKIPIPELEAAEVFPAEIDGVHLDVIQGPYRVNLTTLPADHRVRSPYLMGGLSCGRVNEGTGTIGAVVIDQATGRPALLSNWHVLAGPRAMVGDPIVQPGQIDSGVPVRDEVAMLSRWMLETGGDAAIAEIGGVRPWLPLQYGNFSVTGKARDPELGEILCKSGRTTGFTRARVDGEGFYRLLYEVQPGVKEMREIKGFKLVPIQPGNPGDVELSSGGDSGSFWQSEGSGDAVGLHFAGEGNSDPALEHSIACYLTTVLKRLNARIATFDDVFEAAVSDHEVSRAGLTPTAQAAVLRGGDLRLPDWPVFPDPGSEHRLPLPWPWPWPWVADPRGIGPGLRDRTRSARARSLVDARSVVGPLVDGRLGPELEFDPYMHRAERSLGIVSDIWPRLQIALQSNPDFAGARLSDRLDKFIISGNAAAVMARIINQSAAFDDIGLPKVFETDFDGAWTFAHICEDIIKVLVN
ncbi:hypothetical protein [Labrenzia sp. OB1]|uniref:hypothetical protein n=1 Tax=Labrenzia sp. OB1 TaxID=1561204 RepID=UPI0008396188|nr:hypothetical protein [Labrenzia sp. OB1]